MTTKITANSTSIDEATIRKVAKLARLSLSEEEVRKFLPELQDIMAAFSTIGELDTASANMSVHPIELRNHLRPDTPGESLSTEAALSNTPHKKDSYFKGPSAI
jgi:aspartyl-tRNA(Asn)/glutamyl-tRNA(Gln) amidotransferase subunit C